MGQGFSQKTCGGGKLGEGWRRFCRDVEGAGVGRWVPDNVQEDLPLSRGWVGFVEQFPCLSARVLGGG